VPDLIAVDNNSVKDIRKWLKVQENSTLELPGRRSKFIKFSKSRRIVPKGELLSANLNVASRKTLEAVRRSNGRLWFAPAAGLSIFHRDVWAAYIAVVSNAASGKLAR
jgi:hypothetical protein